jgi:hypothetical protein
MILSLLRLTVRQAAAQKAAEEERIRQQLALGFDINEIKKKGSNLGDIALSVTAATQQLMEAAAAAQAEVCCKRMND